MQHFKIQAKWLSVCFSFLLSSRSHRFVRIDLDNKIDVFDVLEPFVFFFFKRVYLVLLAPNCGLDLHHGFV